jgi:DNA polymerase III sliding clamp (beta) subunit (PCNA family)
MSDVDILSWLNDTESVTPALEVKSTRADSLVAPEVSGTCFEVQREVLLSLLEKCIGIVPTKDIVPVLTNFQFHVAEGELKVVASSAKISIVVSTQQVNTKVPGIEVFPARTLFNIVKESNVGSTIYVEVTASGAVIVSGGFSAEIAMVSKKGFPVMDTISSVTFHEVNRLEFLHAVNAVKYALPDKDYSGQASMKMINIKGGKFTACDGSRFQQVRIDSFKLSMKLPALSIAALVKLLSSTDMETIDIGETVNDKLVFRLGPTVLYVNKLSDAYPNVEQLWLRPALSNDQELIVDRAELVTAIKQVRFALDTASPAIGLRLNGNQITISARGVNDSRSVVIGCEWSGKPRTIAVNCYHFAEMLKAYPEKECKFMLGEDTKMRKSPILLKDEETQAIATISQVLSYRAGLDS